MTSKNVKRTDGKRSVSVGPSKWSSSNKQEVTVCSNGYQSMSFDIDIEMLGWLRDAIDEYMAQPEDMRFCSGENQGE